MMIVFTALIGHCIKTVMVLFLKVIKSNVKTDFHKSKETYHFFLLTVQIAFMQQNDIIEVNLCEFLLVLYADK